jgi:hypothetical protein
MAAPLGVVAAALVAVSYLGIKGGIDGLVGRRPAARWPDRRRVRLVKFFTRYAILPPLRRDDGAFVVPPVAILAGASSIVVAAMLEALHPRR